MLITVAGADSKFCAEIKGLLASQDHRARVLPLSGLLESLQEAPPHLAVLVGPSSGSLVVSLLREVREDPRMRQMPILCVSPKSGSAEGVACLDAGADDFINRPFNAQIFLARVRTLLRRRIWSGDLEEDPANSLHCGPIAIKLMSRQATLDGGPLPLTRLEFDLLALLLRNLDRVFPRRELLEAVWNYPEDVETRTLDKHVENLRRKLAGCGRSIETVHGVGYRFANPEPSAGR